MQGKINRQSTTKNLDLQFVNWGGAAFTLK